MYKLSQRSRKKLRHVHYDLSTFVYEWLRTTDISIIEGWRSPEKQKEMCEKGFSKLLIGNHNYINPSNNKCSLAVDIYPYPLEIDAWEISGLSQWEKFCNEGQELADYMHKKKLIYFKIQNRNISMNGLTAQSACPRDYIRI